MSEKKINLKEILEEAIYNQLYGKGSEEARRAVARSSSKSGSWEFMIEAMKEACKQVLELAAKNATTEYDSFIDDNFVDKQSILDTIKQVE